MNYREEEVLVQGHYPLAATLGMPVGKGPFPAVVIVAGSGNGDRDGNIQKAKLSPNMYRDLAVFLGGLGCVTLRADKRGTGKSGGVFITTGMHDLVEDILTLADYLKAHPKVGKVILLGHSEGCTLIAAANAKCPMDGLVFLAGGAESLNDAVKRQRDLVSQEMRHMKGLKGALIRLTKAYNKVEKQAQKFNVKILATKKPVIRIQLQKMNARWYREHLLYDVFEDLAKVTCPALAINGSTDVQVTPEKALELGNYVKGPAEAHVIEGMNHLLKENSKQASLLHIIKEYRADMDKPLHPELKERIADWLQKHDKSLAYPA
ncbi:alpha/beta hydrolase [Anoxynatronum sibiricum]|uniref:Alpha/beta fold hydrolase n=1 Tax=Anoxynatronum sibiricum TaxID=210623 RepID=A0ABU9VVF4_9CLOT